MPGFDDAILLVVAGENLLNDASARYMVNVPVRDLRAAKAALTSDLAAAAKVAMFKPVDVSLCMMQMRPRVVIATGTARSTAPRCCGRECAWCCRGMLAWPEHE